MSLYSIILADDEEEIRYGIKRKIDWEANGFELVGTAENGQEALELAENLHPDVVMTDIKMPFMDGLTLGKRLLETMPTTKLVLFSGFDDFEYAQTAIKINAAEYILKPINSAELTAVLQKLKKKLDDEFAEKRDIERLRRHYKNSLPLLRELFFAQMMDGRISQERIQQQADLYDINVSAPFWTVALVHYDKVERESSPIHDSELIPLSLKQLIDETLNNAQYKSILYNDYVAVIVNFQEQNQILSFIDQMDQVCKLARRFLILTLTIGIGVPCETLADLHFSTAGAQTALDYRVLLGCGKAIYIGDVEPNRAGLLQLDDQRERSLISAIKLSSPDEIRRAADQFIGQFKATRFSLGHYQLYLMEMMSELLRVIRTYQIHPSEVFGKDFDGNFHLTRFESPEELYHWFSETCLKISVLIRRERTNSTRAIADEAKQFIMQNYQNSNISVEMLCNHLHVSPAYFSTLFKKETGMSFVAYLTDVRMEEAMKLLSTTECKTYEIAQKIGYMEPNYFSYVFKKQFGLSPTKYRSSKGEILVR